MITVTIEDGELVADIERWMRMNNLRRGVEAAGAHILDEMQYYPPPRARSRYRRTGTLGRSWTARTSRRGLRVTIGNNTPYAPYVQGDKQTDFHRVTGWRKAGRIAERDADYVATIISRYVGMDL